MRRMLAVAAFSVLALSAGAVLAQDPISAREPTMKNVGRAFGAINRMNRGQDAFDAAKATEAFHTISANAKTFATLFPDSAKEGDKNAKPEIWTQKADFDARVKKLAADAEAGATAAAKGEAAFKTAFAAVQPQCGGCHQVYRSE